MSLNVRLESMSHADGKVYLQMALDRLRPDAEVFLTARLKDGMEIPSHLFPFRPLEASSQANYVVVVPRLSVREIDLFFVERAEGDIPLSQARLTVELNMMKWRTRINAIVHTELTSQIFDIEREYSVDRMSIFLTDAVPDGDEIVVKMLVDMPNVVDADVGVDFIDLDGRLLELPVYPLLDEVVCAARFGDEERLHVGFSVRVSAEAKDFCVMATDMAGLVKGGFAVFCDETYAPLADVAAQCLGDAAHDDNYERWYLHHCETLAGLALQRRADLPCRPTISLVMPVFAGDEPYLSASLRAIRQQTYEAFELVVVDVAAQGFSYLPAVHEWEDDARLVHIVAEEGLGQAAARLTGVLQSKGDAIAIVDPSIILAPEALFEYVRCVSEAKVQAGLGGGHDVAPCDLVYSNHDSFGRETGFYAPSFKPVFSPELLMSYDYLGPVAFVSRRVVDAIAEGEGFATEAFEYDLFFKVSERAERIDRIDRVLYHVQDASSISEEAQSIRVRREEEAFRGGRKAVANHLRRIGEEATVLSEVAGRFYRVRYRRDLSQASLAIVVSYSGDCAMLDECLASILSQRPLLAGEIVVAGASDEDLGSLESCSVARDAGISLSACSAEGASSAAALRNAGARQTSSEYMLFLDDDVELPDPESVALLFSRCSSEGVGVVGAKLLSSDDLIRHAGMMVGSQGFAVDIGLGSPRSDAGYFGRFSCVQNLSAVSCSAAFVRRSVFVEVGGFDERFVVCDAGVDFCLKVGAAGKRVVYDGSVELYCQSSSDPVLDRASLVRRERECGFFRYRWPQYFIDGDPYLSGGFDRDAAGYHLALAE